MKMMIALFLTLAAVHSHAGNAYPRVPDQRLTPGSLCTSPTEYRYPERIPYCERTLNSFGKEVVFINYRKLGFSLSGERSQYKVDHLIPLCAGGSNEVDNLWPQYYTISALTDPLEPLGCEVLRKGKITQRELVDLVLKAKFDAKEIQRVMTKLRALNR